MRHIIPGLTVILTRPVRLLVDAAFLAIFHLWTLNTTYSKMYHQRFSMHSIHVEDSIDISYHRRLSK